MELLLIRHAKAEDRDSQRWSDDSLRPISEKGEATFKNAASRLGKLIQPRLVLSSPYLRAMQTAQILTDVAGWPAADLRKDVAEGDLDAVVREQFDLRTTSVAVIGHEPSISRYLGQLVADGSTANLRIRPGSAALVDLSRPDRGELQWLVPSKLLDR